MCQRVGRPRFKKKALSDPTLNYSERGFCLKSGRLRLTGNIETGVVRARDGVEGVRPGRPQGEQAA